MFQSTLPRRERRIRMDILYRMIQGFNPRSREGSDHPAGCNPDGECGFNPRSREGSDVLQEWHWTGMRRFNPRSREGSDLFARVFRIRIKGFNPRSREGSDDTGFVYTGQSLEVSIHAPAKGATAVYGKAPCFIHVSIHAPAKGATTFHSWPDTSRRMFQSTLPRRERRWSGCNMRRIWACFNPRSREGSDRTCSPWWEYGCSFNPRSREGSDTTSFLF